MIISDAENLQFADKTRNTINLTITTDQYGAIPYTAFVDDIAPQGRVIYERCLSGEWGSILPPNGYIEDDGEFVMLPEFAAEQLEQAKLAAKKDVLAFADKARQTLAGSPSALEASSWAAKEARARRVVEGIATESDLATVELEAQERNLGESAQQLATLQIAKANQLMMAVAIIDGMTKSALAALAEASDPASLEHTLPQLKVAGEARLQQLLTTTNS